jgi:hypothetical protein
VLSNKNRERDKMLKIRIQTDNIDEVEFIANELERTGLTLDIDTKEVVSKLREISRVAREKKDIKFYSITYNPTLNNSLRVEEKEGWDTRMGTVIKVVKTLKVDDIANIYIEEVQLPLEGEVDFGTLEYIGEEIISLKIENGCKVKDVIIEKLKKKLENLA